MSDRWSVVPDVKGEPPKGVRTKIASRPAQNREDYPESMVVGVRHLSQFEARTLCLGLSDELRRDACAPAALHHKGGNGNVPAVRDPIEAIALRIDVAVELVCPSTIGELSAPTFGEMANDLRGGVVPSGRSR